MKDFRIGNGYDVHALREGLPMFLCGVQIESPVGFVAHSDGDVAIHALSGPWRHREALPGLIAQLEGHRQQETSCRRDDSC